MRVTVLGCWSGGVPAPGGRASGYLFEEEDARLLLDCGNGVVGNLVRHTRIDDLTGVLITHTHFDHVGDLHPLALFLKHTKGKKALAGPPGIRTLLYRWFSLFTDDPDSYVQTFAITEYKPWTPFKMGSVDVTPCPVEHGPHPAFALRLASRDKTFVYSGDTKESALLEEACQGADFLLAEATYSDSADPRRLEVHMTGRQAATLARRANVKALALTHHLITQDQEQIRKEAEDAYGRPVRSVREDDVLTVD
ncbi:MAG: MBL fold metallo-hydrolase [Thermoplasmatota archaeon]